MEGAAAAVARPQERSGKHWPVGVASHKSNYLQEEEGWLIQT